MAQNKADTEMTREQIEKAARDYALYQLGIVGLPGRAEAMKAFISGAEWIMNCLCRMPLNIAISELHGYVKEKLETEKEKKL